jgi:type I restriction enzyme M protein
MDQATHNQIVSFIWGIAKYVLRGVFVRGKDHDVILPRCVLRTLEEVRADILDVERDPGGLLDDLLMERAHS